MISILMVQIYNSVPQIANKVTNQRLFKTNINKEAQLNGLTLYCI